MISYLYEPRELRVNIGVWESSSHKFKVYGIVAKNRDITDTTLLLARSFLLDVISEDIAPCEQDNSLGFVIIHPGELGVSVLVHW
ncbi:MAG: hypothetical protein KTR18_14650 [Acidiferrobacterales bacterium]|nr:hypothetical protein [Acidiferrobacterales bacterium]